MALAPLRGIAKAPGALYDMVTGLGSAYKTATVGSPEQQPKTLAEADKFYNNRPMLPRLQGTVEGLVSGAALGIPERFLPETTDPDRLAHRTLGGAVGSALPFNAGANALTKLGYGTTAKLIGLPAAASPLNRYLVATFPAPSKVP